MKTKDVKVGFQYVFNNQIVRVMNIIQKDTNKPNMQNGEIFTGYVRTQKHFKLSNGLIVKASLLSEFDSIESEMNIEQVIESKNVIGGVPSGSDYAMLSLSGVFIQKFYKFFIVKHNDGTFSNILHYFSEQKVWCPSAYNRNGDDYKILSQAKFLKIKS